MQDLTRIKRDHGNGSAKQYSEHINRQSTQQFFRFKNILQSFCYAIPGVLFLIVMYNGFTFYLVQGNTCNGHIRHDEDKSAGITRISDQETSRGMSQYRSR